MAASPMPMMMKVFVAAKETTVAVGDYFAVRKEIEHSVVLFMAIALMVINLKKEARRGFLKEQCQDSPISYKL